MIIRLVCELNRLVVVLIALNSLYPAICLAMNKSPPFPGAVKRQINSIRSMYLLVIGVQRLYALHKGRS